MVPATLLFYLFYFPPSFTQLHGRQASTWHELKKIDFIGTFLLVAGLAIFLLGISWSRQAYPWTCSTVLGLGLLIPGAICLVVFVLYEVYGGPELPIILAHFFLDVTGFTPIVVISAVHRLPLCHH